MATSLIAAIIDRFFAKDLWVEITPDVFTFCLEASQLSLKTVIWIQKSRKAVLAVGEELSRDEIQQKGIPDDIQRINLFPADPGVTDDHYLEVFFSFRFYQDSQQGSVHETESPFYRNLQSSTLYRWWFRERPARSGRTICWRIGCNFRVMTICKPAKRLTQRFSPITEKRADFIYTFMKSLFSRGP